MLASMLVLAATTLGVASALHAALHVQVFCGRLMNVCRFELI